MELECSKCKQTKDYTEFYDGTECYDCWEENINEEKVKELRKELNQYLEIDKFKIKDGLNLDQLEKLKKIIMSKEVILLAVKQAKKEAKN